MFFIINSAYLLSLGFLSWTILCYFKQIEQNLLEDSNKSAETLIDFPTMAEKPIQVNIKTSDQPNNYDIYVNFVCIFVCIYALAKITNLAEKYVAQKIYHKIYKLPSSETELDSLDDLHKQQTNLLRKINKLEFQNLALKYKILEAVDIVDPQETNTEENFNKIYISNRHIHLNHQVYVNKRDVNIQFQKFSDKRENVNDIWNKYFEMQNSSSQNPDSLPTYNEIDVYKPAVISNEELQNNGGLETWSEYLNNTKILNEVSHKPVVLTNQELNNIQ